MIFKAADWRETGSRNSEFQCAGKLPIISRRLEESEWCVSILKTCSRKLRYYQCISTTERENKLLDQEHRTWLLRIEIKLISIQISLWKTNLSNSNTDFVTAEHCCVLKLYGYSYDLIPHRQFFIFYWNCFHSLFLFEILLVVKVWMMIYKLLLFLRLFVFTVLYGMNAGLLIQANSFISNPKCRHSVPAHWNAHSG